MKKQLLTLAAVLVAGITSAQTWSEDFNSASVPGLPSGWLQNNVDGHTVYSGFSAYSFGNDAWVTYGSTNKVVVSTSYYTPAGVSNDWLITPSFTVPTNGVIQWDATAIDASYPDGYLVKIATNNGTTTADFSTQLLSVPHENAGGWNTRSVNLSAYAGTAVRIAFVNNSNDEYLLYLDNISVFIPAANDLKITDVTPTGQNVWGAIGDLKTISGSVQNNGYNVITSFTASYLNGTNVVNSVITGLNLGYGQSTTFNIATPVTISLAELKNYKVYVDATGDNTHTNDTLTTEIGGYAFTPDHKVVFEEATGTWCGWCVRGMVYMDSVHVMSPDNTVLIAVHGPTATSGQDPMTVAVYANGTGSLIDGYPSVLCDREVEIGDPMDMFDLLSAHIGDFALANLSITATYDEGSRNVVAKVNYNFATSFANNSAANDFRFAVVFTEDSVKGTTAGYDQHNYYSYASQNIPLVGAGHDFQSEPATISHTNIIYNYVARTIIGGFSGQANSLPNNIVEGTIGSYSVAYSVPNSFKLNHMNAHVLLIDANNNEIYNGNSSALTTNTYTYTGIRSQTIEKVAFVLYPNPASTKTTLSLNLASSETVNIKVYNTLGEVVYSSAKPNLSAGTHQVDLNTEILTSGIYHVSVSTSKGTSTQKLSISK